MARSDQLWNASSEAGAAIQRFLPCANGATTDPTIDDLYARILGAPTSADVRCSLAVRDYFAGSVLRISSAGSTRSWRRDAHLSGRIGGRCGGALDRIRT